MKRLLPTVFRFRLVVFAVAFALGALGVVLRALGPDWVQDLASMLHLAFPVIPVVLLFSVVGGRLAPKEEVRVVASPVRGRWLAMNSPATKVPSHGLRAYGQAYAVDLVYEPDGTARPAFGSGPAFGRNEDYPAFGEPVYAMVDGMVVAASDWRRDHRSRGRLVSVLYMLLEGMIRELGGPGFIVGNHVTIRTEDGDYALVAHLRQRSATVRVGDHVQAGDVIGACGNSGNSSEPHVHAQLMDRKNLLLAQGIPLEFAGVCVGDSDAVGAGMPANEEYMVVPVP